MPTHAGGRPCNPHAKESRALWCPAIRAAAGLGWVVALTRQAVTSYSENPAPEARDDASAMSDDSSRPAKRCVAGSSNCSCMFVCRCLQWQTALLELLGAMALKLPGRARKQRRARSQPRSPAFQGNFTLFACVLLVVRCRTALHGARSQDDVPAAPAPRVAATATATSDWAPQSPERRSGLPSLLHWACLPCIMPSCSCVTMLCGCGAMLCGCVWLFAMRHLLCPKQQTRPGIRKRRKHVRSVSVFGGTDSCSSDDDDDLEQDDQEDRYKSSCPVGEWQGRVAGTSRRLPRG